MRFLFLMLTLVFLSVQPLSAALAAPVAEAAATPSSTFTPADLSREAVETKLGRKLKFTERIALSIARKKAKKQARKRAKNGPGDGTVTDTPSLLALIFGIIGIPLTFVFGIGILFSIAALVLGIVGLGRIKREEGYRKGRGLAITGIVLGGLMLLLLLLGVAVLLLFFA
jgi:hypothetical protein